MTIVVLTIVNCLGVRAGRRLQSVLMVLKIVAIAALVLAGMLLIRSPYPLQHPVLDRAPSIYLVTSIGAAMVQRNLSRALVMGVAGVIVLYTGVNFVCV